MKKLNKKAEAIFTKLISGLADPYDAYEDRTSHRKIGKAGGPFMQVSVERIGKNTYSIAHYYEQNGDLMSDPEVTFFVNERGVLPCTYTQSSLGMWKEHVSFDRDGNPTCHSVSGQADLAGFCNDWMVNISKQQKLSFTPPEVQLFIAKAIGAPNEY